MRPLTRYVLFYCDDCRLLDPAIESFKSVHKFHEVLTSSKPEDFFEKITSYAPELLFIYLNDPTKDYMPLIRSIRESPEWSGIPMLVYKTLPQPEEMMTIFQKLQNFD